MNSESTSEPQEAAPRWQAVGPIDRRVLGVLVEKAKTVPSAYPMTANAICTGANQKNNRDPVMQLEIDDVEESLERLRELKAVGMIEGIGRVQKYRHYLYEWLGVDKVELAVMAELLLRGAQTEGELRGRASRMEPIADLGVLRTILQSLKEKRLIVPLTPEGRGHMLTHNLYPQRELDNLRREIAQRGATTFTPSDDEYARASPVAAVPIAARPQPADSAAPFPASPAAAPAAEVADLRRAVEQLRTLVAQLRSDVDDLTASLGQTADEVRRLKSDLGG